MNPSISIVVAVKDQSSRLALTLAALEQQQTSPDDFEVIVVDDHSANPVATWALCDGPRPGYALQVLECSSFGRRGIPRNLGAKRARGELLVFLDADACPGTQLLTQHTSVHAAAKDRVAVGDCYVVRATETLDDPIRGIPFHDSRGTSHHVTAPVVFSLDEIRRDGDVVLARHARKGIYPDSEARQRWLERMLSRGSRLAWAGVIPHNLSMTRGTFEALGGFDEGLRHLEGWDLGIRALQKNFSLTWAAGAQSFHLYHRRSIPALQDNVTSALNQLRSRHPDAGVDAVMLWGAAIRGDTGVPQELGLSNPAAVEELLLTPEGRAKIEMLEVGRRIGSPMDYWLNSINSSLTLSGKAGG